MSIKEILVLVAGASVGIACELLLILFLGIFIALVIRAVLKLINEKNAEKLEGIK
jgi:hypothetical protein